MTTSVKVTACCDPKTTQVRVDKGPDMCILADGESSEFFVYDDQVVSVREMARPDVTVKAESQEGEVSEK